MQWTGNTVLITGGGSGIGRALAESLHRLGNDVIIAGRRRQLLQTVKQGCPGVQYATLDLGDAADIQRSVAEVTQRHPNLNVLINNAGVMATEDLTAGDASAAEQTITINLLGSIRLTAALLPRLLTQPRGAVINVTSALAFVPKAITPTYCATKAALHSYTESLRTQLRGSTVEVIEIIPPRVATDIQGTLDPDPNAMPVDVFVADVTQRLLTVPSAEEIVVDQAARLRSAERSGHYDQAYDAVNLEFATPETRLR